MNQSGIRQKSNNGLTPMVCGQCGAQLPMPKGITRMVKCSFCGTMHLINWNTAADGSNTATAMLGLTGTVSEDNIKEKVLEMLLASKCTPLDVFENGVVEDVVEVGVPAFWFDNVTIRGHILYERKYTFTTTHEEGEGDKRHTVYDNHVEWRPHTLEVSEERDFVVSANKEYSDIIKKFYCYEDIETEYINSINVEDVLDKDIPDGTAFLKDIKPELESRMLELAKNTLLTEQEGQRRTFLGVELNEEPDIRNISVSGTEADRRQPRTIWIALFKVCYRYNDKIYPLYLSHDGMKSFYKETPIDNARFKILEGLRKSAEEKEKEIRNQLFGYSMISAIAIVIGIICIVCGVKAYDMAPKVLEILAGFLLGVVSILMIRKRIKEGKRLLPTVKASWDAYEAKENELKSVKKSVNISSEAIDKIHHREENYADSNKY